MPNPLVSFEALGHAIFHNVKIAALFSPATSLFMVTWARTERLLNYSLIKISIINHLYNCCKKPRSKTKRNSFLKFLEQ